MQKDNVIRDKSYSFALAIVGLYKLLIREHKEFVLSKQVLRSGTSIGANVQEALEAESKADFIHKMTISLKEARETSYWLRLLKDSGYFDQYELLDSCKELISILVAIIKTAKGQNHTNRAEDDKA